MPRRPLTQDERLARSEAQAAHWKRVSKVSELSGLTKGEVNRLWPKIREGGLIGDAVRGEDRALRKVRGWAKGLYAVVPLLTVDSEPKLANRVKIMLWAIEKCGGLEPARDAFSRAERALTP